MYIYIPLCIYILCVCGIDIHIHIIHIHIIHILRKRWHVSIVLFCLVYSPIFSGEPLRLAAKGTDLRRLPKRISCIASFLWAQSGLDATKNGSSPEKNHGKLMGIYVI